jgi:hypothetical protein
VGIHRELSPESIARAERVKQEKAKRKIVVPTFKQILNWESWRKRLEQREKQPVNPPKPTEAKPKQIDPEPIEPQQPLTFQQKIDQHLKKHAQLMDSMRDRASRKTANDGIPGLWESYFD